jgi:lysophospholipase L1-like esterase
MRSVPRRLVLPLAVFLLVLVFAGTAFATDKYVALGDSYSSGTGTRSYTLDSTCQRGVYAYPYLVAQARPNTSLTFVACSGAQTADVLNKQVSSVTTDTRFVTITIGGNDAGFSSVITQCALPWPWSCDSNITNAQNFIRNTLPGRLDNVYNAIRSHAPTATVIVLGYPRLFMGVDCNAGTFFSGDEMTKLNATADLMRDVESARAAAHGFVFKDAIPPFIGHAVCSSTEWLNGLSDPVSDSYHPNRTGHSSGYAPLVRSVTG